MRKWAADHTGRAALLIGLLVALLWAPQLWSFLGRDTSERVNWRFLPARDALENWELRSLDARFAARGIVKPRSLDKIAIVGIDQNSLGLVGQWPWPRSLHARLIDRLKAAGARAIVLDLDFSDRQFPGAEGELSREDEALIEAAGRAGNVVLPSLLNSSHGARSERDLSYQLATPFVADERGNAGLDEQTLDLGLAGLSADADGRFRTYPFAARIGGETLGGLAPLSAGVYQGLIDAEGSEAYQKALASGVWPGLDKSDEVPTRARQLVGTNAPLLREMPLYFWGPGGTFPTYSYADVLASYDMLALQQRFAGRVVLVGPTAVVLKDNFPAPRFSSATREVEPTIPGVEIHATALAMLLDGAYLYPPGAWVSWLSLLGMALIGALWTERVRPLVSRGARALQSRWSARGHRSRIYDAAWFGLYVLVAALPIVAFWGMGTALFRAANLWMVATYPIGAGAMASALTLMFLFAQESSGRRKVVEQLGLYMDSRVVEEILAHPEEEYPRPRRTQATVLFTDIEGFTSYSESHDAAEVVAALNAFFSRLKPVVSAHGGVVDKFVGDAMMCFWGVPLPHADHARRALGCAIALQEECARFPPRDRHSLSHPRGIAHRRTHRGQRGQPISQRRRGAHELHRDRRYGELGFPTRSQEQRVRDVDFVFARRGRGRARHRAVSRRAHPHQGLERRGRCSGRRGHARPTPARPGVGRADFGRHRTRRSRAAKRRNPARTGGRRTRSARTYGRGGTGRIGTHLRIPLSATYGRPPRTP